MDSLATNDGVHTEHFTLTATIIEKCKRRRYVITSLNVLKTVLRKRDSTGCDFSRKSREFFFQNE